MHLNCPSCDCLLTETYEMGVAMLTCGACHSQVKMLTGTLQQLTTVTKPSEAHPYLADIFLKYPYYECHIIVPSGQEWFISLPMKRELKHMRLDVGDVVTLLTVAPHALQTETFTVYNHRAGEHAVCIRPKAFSLSSASVLGLSLAGLSFMLLSVVKGLSPLWLFSVPLLLGLLSYLGVKRRQSQAKPILKVEDLPLTERRQACADQLSTHQELLHRLQAVAIRLSLRRKPVEPGRPQRVAHATKEVQTLIELEETLLASYDKGLHLLETKAGELTSEASQDSQALRAFESHLSAIKAMETKTQSLMVRLGENAEVRALLKAMSI